MTRYNMLSQGKFLSELRMSMKRFFSRLPHSLFPPCFLLLSTLFPFSLLSTSSWREHFGMATNFCGAAAHQVLFPTVPTQRRKARRAHHSGSSLGRATAAHSSALSTRIINRQHPDKVKLGKCNLYELDWGDVCTKPEKKNPLIIMKDTTAKGSSGQCIPSL